VAAELPTCAISSALNIRLGIGVTDIQGAVLFVITDLAAVSQNMQQCNYQKPYLPKITCFRTLPELFLQNIYFFLLKS
jgi:hypothetical protein